MSEDLSKILICAFCGADMRVAQDCSSDLYFAECLNVDCGIATPYKETYEEIINIIVKKESIIEEK